MKKYIKSAVFSFLVCSRIFGQEKSDPVYFTPAFSIYKDHVTQDKWTSRIYKDNEIISNYPIDQPRWTLKKDVSSYPQFHSEYAISDALYNLSLEEMTNLIEADSTWRTGQLWGGVWTRDVSYSTLLAMAYMRPDICMVSLLKKTRNGKIIQDTGTGGSYPVSTDRIVWALAAWQIYKVTGDRAWLSKVYEIIKNSIQQDAFLVYDPITSLVKGESSFLDWREESYPRWAQPADIAQSECLGTNAIHFEANVIAAQMAQILGHTKDASLFSNNAEKIKTGINRYLWLPTKGYYSQFLYGRSFLQASPRSEALGEALCIIFGIADSARAQQVVRSVPQNAYGISCIFPQISEITPYHNNAIWPFVQSYWMWASAKAGNSKAVMESIAAIYRAAALFATNKENFIAESGDYNTETNSSNMLWSISGNISIVHRIFFGLQFENEKLTFHPFIPKELEGTKTLRNFKYRNAMLNITVHGYGNHIAKFTLDGKVSTPRISSRLGGFHNVDIILDDNNETKDTLITKVNNHFSPNYPTLYLSSNRSLAWTKIPNIDHYKILCNGIVMDSLTNRNINDLHWDIPIPEKYTEYQVIAIDSNGYEGFASEPLAVYAPQYKQVISLHQDHASLPIDTIKNVFGTYPIEISETKNTSLNFNATVQEKGNYVIQFYYANGSGSLISENMCANRTLMVDNKVVSVVSFPQRGKDLWNVWGYSGCLLVQLGKGLHLMSLSFGAENENMNQQGINRALLDHVNIIQVQ